MDQPTLFDLGEAQKSASKPSGEVYEIFTAGYGNRIMSQFRRLLAEAEIDVVIDVRVDGTGSWSADYTMPTIKKKLKGFEYICKPELGNVAGLLGRYPYGDSPAIRLSKLKSYKDWLDNTEDGKKALADLVSLIEDRRGKRVCLMCCERLAFKDGKCNCHRTIVAESVARVFHERRGKKYSITHL